MPVPMNSRKNGWIYDAIYGIIQEIPNRERESEK